MEKCYYMASLTKAHKVKYRNVERERSSDESLKAYQMIDSTFDVEMIASDS